MYTIFGYDNNKTIAGYMFFKNNSSTKILVIRKWQNNFHRQDSTSAASQYRLWHPNTTGGQSLTTWQNQILQLKTLSGKPKHINRMIQRWGI